MHRPVIPFLVALLAVLALPLQSYSDPSGDINGDGHVGLPDAITTLQIVSGIRTSVPQTIDFRDYLWQPGLKYDYIRNACLLENHEWEYYTEEYFVAASMIVLGNTPVMRVEEQQEGLPSIRSYYSIKDGKVSQIAYSFFRPDENTESVNCFYPPVAIGTSTTGIGDKFSNVYSWNWSTNISECTSLQGNVPPWFVEYIFIGFENVTTPAGTFTECLKLSRTDTRTPGIRFEYYAKNIGLVKTVLCLENGGSVTELTRTTNVDD